jgi:hypothetical protein
MRVAVIPARNEQDRLADVVRDIRNRVEVVLVIDDDSQDSTGRIADAQGCVVLRNSSHRGYGETVRRGLLWCRDFDASVVITIDGDGQHKAQWIEEAIPLLAEGADVVFANRFFACEGVPNTKCLSNNLAWHCMKSTIGRDPVCEDVSCGFRAYSTNGLTAAIEAPTTEARGYAFTYATCAHLHRSVLNLAAFPVPAIYKEPVLGTPVGELRDFLTWVSGSAPLENEAKMWLKNLDRGSPIVFEFEGWRTRETVRAIAHNVDGHVQFSMAPNLDNDATHVDVA